MFKYSNSNKRYHTEDFYLKNLFGEKVCKVPLDGGFTCPNIDGTKGKNGCTYCSGVGSGDFILNAGKDISEQFEAYRLATQKKWQANKFIAYFQAHSNTYGTLDRLKALYEQALKIDGVVGLSIATRADCLSDEIVAYLSTLNERTHLTIELGLQTAFDSTALAINRCHNYEDFLLRFNKLKKHNIKVCVHLINGLPNETKEMMLHNAKAVSELGTFAVKLHLLHILKGTKIAEQYENCEFNILSQDEYVEIICDQLEVISPEVVIERITGDGDKSILIAPKWSENKRAVLNAIDMEMARRNSFQGIKLK